MVFQLKNFLENEKQKKYAKLVFYTCLWIVFVFIALLFMFKNYSYFKCDLVFNSDSPRVFYDWTDVEADHYRTKTHPLYILFVYPFVKLFGAIFSSDLIGVSIFLATISVLNVLLISSILKKLKKIEGLKQNLFFLLFLAFYIVSFMTIESLMVVESFVVGTFTLLVFWLFYASKYGKELNIFDYVLLALLGVLCFSICTTNILQFVIGIAFLIVFNKKKSGAEFWRDFGIFVLILLSTFVMCYWLIKLQMKWFPSSKSAISYVIDCVLDIFKGTNQTEELTYISGFSLSSILTVFVYSFGFAFTGINPYFDGCEIRLNINAISYILATVMFLIFVYACVMIVKNKKTHQALPIFLAFCCEVLLHLFYGITSPYLYLIGYVPLMLILIYMGLSQENNQKVQIAQLSVLGAFDLALAVANTIASVKMIKLINIGTGVKNNTSLSRTVLLVVLFGVCVVGALVVLAILAKRLIDFLKTKHFENFKPWAWVSMALAMVFCVTGAVLSPIAFAKIDRTYSVDDDSTISYYFGMGLRDKFVCEQNLSKWTISSFDYKDNSKIDIMNGLDFVSYDSENYVLTFKNNAGENVVLYENEDGIYLQKPDETIALDDSIHLNIPTFEKYSHSGLLRQTFKECMISITKDGVWPNLKKYYCSWHRGCAMVAMVAKQTGNLNHITPWIESLTADDIYDLARTKTDWLSYNLYETDNLGEVLYLESLLDTPNMSVVNAVLEEAKRLKVSGEGYIKGITDYGEKPAYQTKWLLFGMNQLGLDASEFSLGDATDDYLNMCWFYNREPDGTLWAKDWVIENLFNQDVDPWPYRNWARLHYYQIKIDLPSNLSYPITHEDHEYPHAWTASEMFLYLIDYDTF